MREAAVVLIIKDGLILGISRRVDKTKFGLLGGKLDPGETPAQAAVRESREEAGVNIKRLVPIFKRVERRERPDGEDFITHCFYAVEWDGEPQPSEEGEVKWLTEKEITETMAAFGDYNIATLKSLKEKYPHIKIKYDR
jgi:8-oxo-dGTP pyrophosphatase MutT (NUDIX family)